MKMRAMLAAGALLCAGAAKAAAGGVSVETVEASIEKAIGYLRKKQAKDGGFGERGRVGITALCVTAMTRSHLKLRGDDPAVAKAVKYVLGWTQENGGLYEPGIGVANYNTSMAMVMLASLENPKYKENLRKAKDFIVGIQRKTDKKSDPMFGGIGYTRDKDKPDLSNTHWAVEALKEAENAGVKVDPEVYKNVLVFLRRCQNDGEVNDQEWAAVVNDGGAVYRPGDTKAGTVKIRGRVGLRSYGSITYAMLKAYMHADLKKDDPAVKGALKWIRNNYTLDENPGLQNQGRFYYYMTFAKSLDAHGTEFVREETGEKHDWAVELAGILLKLQRDDGSWVNTADRWYENDAALVTGYTLAALNIVRNRLAARKSK